MHEEVEEGGGEHGSLQDSICEVSCCGWLAIVFCVSMSACEVIGKPFLEVYVYVCVENLLNE